ncbi:MULTISPECIES: tetratricopeptide repeat protein [unclassified Streptomyces]|uniref:tetratricopeptide repeat protein n=1 Tax=unclassified Streptomyces TaxID=2593676 RepID=UPI002253D9E8|nr:MULTISPECIES: tetratricopeptide repeat protein [unclassified Streptomyces]MCX4992131.1 tetratricopeptide repeat protein [Streptomyces sp. NBC_00568]MCX5002633.1 tetratricopeptide repeat protein [Streptomyces sp. NBC_00638]
MQQLRRAAVEEGKYSQRANALGRPISLWNPYDLEVHPADALRDVSRSGHVEALLPAYVLRDHDQVLSAAVTDALQGRSRLLVLVGSSSTGKTRACWEAVQPLADHGWRLWHPFDPTRADAALEDLHRVRPQTVVWLNEAQHYLGDATLGERVASAAHALLTDPGRMPVLILGTLWPDYARQYMALPSPGQPDPHSRVRELLAGRTLSVPASFDTAALRAAAVLAHNGDRLLADVLTRASTHGQVTQDLAGAPELLRRYQHGTPAARALLEAAMDARRLGVGPYLSQAFLIDAAAGYLPEPDCDYLPDDWAEAAFTELSRPVHGKQAPLRRLANRPPGTPAPVASSPAAGLLFRLADYLEQHGHTARRRLCPPGPFWYAAHTHLTHAEDLRNLATAAQDRYRLQWAHHLRLRAADAGDPFTLTALAGAREKAGDSDGAEAMYRRAADAGAADALRLLASMRHKAGDRESAKALYLEAAHIGVGGALLSLAQAWEREGDQEGAEALAREAADAGDTLLLKVLAKMRDRAGDREGSETLYREAADAGDPYSLRALALLRDRAGDREGAEALARQAADAGDTRVLRVLARLREQVGDPQGAETFAREAADAGDTRALNILARMRERVGDQRGAEAMAREAAAAGDAPALLFLARVREQTGNREGAESLAREAANEGDFLALLGLALMRDAAGDWEGAETLYMETVAGFGAVSSALLALGRIREQVGDPEAAEALYRRAAEAGDTDALIGLAVLRERAGDPEGAEALARQAADADDTRVLLALARIRQQGGNWEAAEAVYREAAEADDKDALTDLALLSAQAGDQQGAETLALQAADAGDTRALVDLGYMLQHAGAEVPWLHGLDADGSPTAPWTSTFE